MTHVQVARVNRLLKPLSEQYLDEVLGTPGSPRALRRLHGLGVTMEALERRILQSAGDPDAGFGAGGMFVDDVHNDFNSVEEVIQDNQGRILAIGEIPASDGNEGALWLGRFLADGTPDSSFGDHGNVIFRGSRSMPTHLALQSDGKIVVEGVYLKGVSDPQWDLGLWRFNGDGSLDTTFGNSGVTVTDLGAREEAYDLAIGSDDKIIVTGLHDVVDYQTYKRTGMDAMLVRYNSDGTIDSSFGHNGVVLENWGADYQLGAKLHVLPDGRIIVGGGLGNTQADGSSRGEFVVVRYSVDGSRDATFGDNGVAMSHFGQARGGGDTRGMSVDDQGNITLASAVFPEDYNAGLEARGVQFVRFTAEGKLDNAFGTDGVQRAPGVVYVWDMTTDAAGNFLVLDGGMDEHFSPQPGSPRVQQIIVARYNHDGMLDRSFGDNGIAAQTIANANEAIGRSIITTRDGGILAAGLTSSHNGDGDLNAYFAKFLGDHSHPTTPQTPAPPIDEQPEPIVTSSGGDATPDPTAPASLRSVSVWSNDLLDPEKDAEELLPGLV